MKKKACGKAVCKKACGQRRGAERQVRSDTHIGWRSSWVGEIQMGESPRSSLVSGVTATKVFTVFKLFVFVFAKSFEEEFGF